MSELDSRLRAGLTTLSDAAERQIHPPGVETVPAAARRHRHAALAIAAVLVLVLAGATVAGWRLARQTGPANRAAAPPCTPVDATAFVPYTSIPGQLTVDEVQSRVADVLRGSPAVLTYTYESQAQAYEKFKEQFKDAPDLIGATKPETIPASYRFTLRCVSDYPAIRQRLITIPGTGVDVICTCDRHTPDKPTASGTR